MTATRARALAMAFTACVGLFTAHFSIRAPDAEVVYRTAESLALRGSFAVPHDLGNWPGFGLPVGPDGRRYSLFSPLQAIVEAPVVWFWEHQFPMEWETEARVPRSHFYSADPGQWEDEPPRPETTRGHEIRALVSGLDVLTMALIAGVVFDLGLLLAGSILAGWLSAVLFTTGTFLLSYTTTLFSEPLAILLTLWGLRLLVQQDRRLSESANPNITSTGLGGLLFGLAVAAHLSAIVALPFAALYATPLGEGRTKRLLAFCLGAAGPLLLLGVFNQVRFGSFWETGRGLQTEFFYGSFTAPGEGLEGLLFAWSKGLLWYCPLMVIAVAMIGPAWRTHPLLASVSLTAVLGRLIFIASRSDWHGGFGMGPRYMLLALPFALLLPLLALRGRSLPRWLPLMGGVFIVEQLYFASGEIFSFSHRMIQRSIALTKAGGSPRLYFDWDFSPFHAYLDHTPGPLLYRWMFPNLWLNWAVLSVVVVGTFLWLTRRIRA